MKLIVGLGNPDAKYVNTRHNTGFMVLDEILKKKNLILKEKFKSFFVKDNDILYALPKTYMNLSGLAVSEIMNFFKLDVKDILVVYDDVSLNLGTIRFRASGSDGGHNGIKSIIKEISSDNFDRLKVGIGQKPESMPLDRFVLEEFKRDEKENMKKIIEIASDACLDWIDKDMNFLQSKYNKSYI